MLSQFKPLCEINSSLVSVVLSMCKDEAVTGRKLEFTWHSKITSADMAQKAGKNPPGSYLFDCVAICNFRNAFCDFRQWFAVQRYGL